MDLEQKLNSITGKSGVMDKIMVENDLLVKRTLEELGLTASECKAENVYGVLVKRLEHMDEHLYNFLDKPDLSKMSMVCGKVCEMALKVNNPQPGSFIKKEKAIEMLATDLMLMILRSEKSWLRFWSHSGLMWLRSF